MEKEIDDFYDDFMRKINELEGTLYQVVIKKRTHNIRFLRLVSPRQHDGSHLCKFYDISNDKTTQLYLQPMNCAPRLKRISPLDLTQDEAQNLFYFEQSQLERR